MARRILWDVCLRLLRYPQFCGCPLSSLSYCVSRLCYLETVFFKGERKLSEKNKNGAGDVASNSQDIDPEIVRKIGALRAQVRESFGKIVMAMMGLPRYRHQSLADLQHLVLDPLIRDRVAIAYPSGKDQSPLTDISGLAIWASVSEEVDAKLRDQIKGGAWPIRLQADDWVSGEINWLIDVIAPDQKTTVSVLGNFKQVVKDGELRLHPIIARLVDKETLEKLGAKRES